jgi:hypothetical protein
MLQSMAVSSWGKRTQAGARGTQPQGRQAEDTELEADRRLQSGFFCGVPLRRLTRCVCQQHHASSDLTCLPSVARVDYVGLATCT